MSSEVYCHENQVQQVDHPILVHVLRSVLVGTGVEASHDRKQVPLVNHSAAVDVGEGLNADQVYRHASGNGPGDLGPIRNGGAQGDGQQE